MSLKEDLLNKFNDSRKEKYCDIEIDCNDLYCNSCFGFI